jgi:hypothetical protein
MKISLALHTVLISDLVLKLRQSIRLHETPSAKRRAVWLLLVFPDWFSGDGTAMYQDVVRLEGVNAGRQLARDRRSNCGETPRI